jgi:hypothetical protein
MTYLNSAQPHALQLSHFLRCNPTPAAAAFRTALHAPADRHDDWASDLHSEATALFAVQHDGILEAIVEAHPVMSDLRRPLLTHQLATLPPAAHAAACWQHVCANDGVAELSMLDAPALVQALQALRGVPRLVDLSIGRDHELTDGGALWQARDGKHAACLEAAAPAPAALTGLTSVRIFGVHVSAAVASVRALAALPALASLSLVEVDPSYDDRVDVPCLDLVTQLGKGLAACTAVTRLDLQNMGTGAVIDSVKQHSSGVGRSACERLLPALARMPRLASLRLPWRRACRVSSYMACISRIAHLCTLRWMRFQRASPETSLLSTLHNSQRLSLVAPSGAGWAGAFGRACADAADTADTPRAALRARGQRPPHTGLRTICSGAGAPDAPCTPGA